MRVQRDQDRGTVLEAIDPVVVLLQGALAQGLARRDFTDLTLRHLVDHYLPTATVALEGAMEPDPECRYLDLLERAVAGVALLRATVPLAESGPTLGFTRDRLLYVALNLLREAVDELPGVDLNHDGGAA